MEVNDKNEIKTLKTDRQLQSHRKRELAPDGAGHESEPVSLARIADSRLVLLIKRNWDNSSEM